jgi:RNA polymerase sigma-70 factor (ECF subfamily)
MSSRSRAALSLVVANGRREVSDAELAGALMAGEDWALTETWQRFGPMVLMTAERTLGSRTESEDATQETFIRVFRIVKRLREPDRLRSFVYSVAVRTLRSQLRHRRLRAWLSFAAPESLVEAEHFSVDFESRARLRRFYALLDRLSARDRLVFVLRRVEEMSIEEIASTMGISASTVKRSLIHASERLSAWLDADSPVGRSFQGRSRTP